MINEVIDELKKIPKRAGLMAFSFFVSGVLFGFGEIMGGVAGLIVALIFAVLFDKVLYKINRILEV